ncbi:hypothetical protein MROS_2685 [Melioribacter roseus P3M-2]|uniref:Uncharacterized protein n=1 Tax=Melioribacter roseus (strain DSM 23840 / JCM 17771 / VKM B-2668 / P3M-2) TaxID=1191523 RepID=I6Z9W0_MELRP|nr:hypothetical protein [Melioribacter roseus]AFN75915.1 hypothetical protein MROS_2685 [Melioribacter roseus P3M-2]
MKNTNNRNKNLEWFQNLGIEEQLNIFQDYAEMLRIVATNLMQEDIEKNAEKDIVDKSRSQADITAGVIIREA